MRNGVILVGSDLLGAREEKLGRLLLGNFFRLLGGRDSVPECIVLWNDGVKAATRGSETLEHLLRLQERGVRVVLCRTCVDYFGIEEEVAAGEIIGMVQILDILADAQVLTV